jgi:bacteriocin-like protein
MTKDQTRDRRTDNSRRELSEDQLAQISGGGHSILSPRDAASGLPTGKRF